MRPVFITLGSNLNPAHNLPWAVGLLADQCELVRTSPVYESTPLGPSGEPLDQPPYLNAAALIHLPDDVPPDVFKFRVLRPIEAGMGRVRTADKFAARPIDLDIALFGSLILSDPAHGITLPDPDILTRAHVALPLADLDPNFLHPTTGEALAAIAHHFDNAPGIARHPLTLSI